MTKGARKADDPEVRVELNFLEGLNNRCPDDARILKALGDLYTGVGEHQKGLEVDERLVRLCPDESGVWYNLGCSYALLGRKDDAFRALFKAVELGYVDHDWMLRDKDLESIRRDTRFRQLLKRVISGDTASQGSN